MLGKLVKWVGEFRVCEELDDKGVFIGYVVVSPDGTVSEVFNSFDDAVDHARNLQKNLSSEYKS